LPWIPSARYLNMDTICWGRARFFFLSFPTFLFVLNAVACLLVSALTKTLHHLHWLLGVEWSQGIFSYCRLQMSGREAAMTRFNSLRHKNQDGLCSVRDSNQILPWIYVMLELMLIHSSWSLLPVVLALLKPLKPNAITEFKMGTLSSLVLKHDKSL